MQTTIAGKAVLVTGANRGLGSALVDEFLRRAVGQVESLDILVNNAGVSVPDDLGDRSAFDHHLAVNLYGTLDVTQAFLGLLTRSHGAVVNVVSLGAVAGVPVLPAYSASKAAALSVTQSLRALLAGRGVRVHAV